MLYISCYIFVMYYFAVLPACGIFFIYISCCTFWCIFVLLLLLYFSIFLFYHFFNDLIFQFACCINVLYELRVVLERVVFFA